ncbi:MAG TPA: hypothetical protein EYN54_10335 [Methylococcaceae bacterium]|nr:hypothetical protein [Methylococcaceae bacterium]
MSFDPLTAAFEAGKLIIEKIWPDPVKQSEEIRKLAELKQKGDLAAMTSHTNLLLAQIKVNEVSAKHPSIFVSGARPAAIWAGVFSMTWAGLVHPMLMWAWSIAQALGWIPKEFNPPPLIESAALGAIVTGLLGVGSMRSYDKRQGNSKDHLK